MQAIYGFKSNVRKDDFYSAFPVTKGAYSTHSAIDKQVHARKRRVLSAGFGDAAMRGAEDIMVKVIEIFCTQLGKDEMVSPPEEGGWSKAKNMAKWTNYLSYDVLGELCYGKSFDTLTSDTNRFAIDLVGMASRYHYINAQIPRMKELGLDRLFFRELRKKRLRFMGYSRARLSERQKLGEDTDRRDFFYYLLKAKDPETGEGFGPVELWGESNTLLVAGSDTSSSAMAASIFYLLHYPRSLERLAKEVRSSFSSAAEIVSGSKLSECTYLRAVLDEAMRLSPPVLALLPRRILPGGMTIDGHHYPEGTVVGVSAYVLHRNPEYFPEPARFIPERWMVEEKADLSTGTQKTFSKDDVERTRSAFCPFSIGSRGCIGKGVAYMEISIALARIVWLYDMRLEEGPQDSAHEHAVEYQIRDGFVAIKDGPWVQFKDREVAS
ncbi:hypothetical protein MMC25_002747 [Agyrium rufum]|nr:hypothetical protein [Agyrium rufum]